MSALTPTPTPTLSTLSVPQTISACQITSLIVPGDLSNKKESEKQQDVEEVESDHAHLERLGRERPSNFKTLWAEIAFVYSISASQFMAVSGCNLTRDYTMILRR